MLTPAQRPAGASDRRPRPTRRSIGPCPRTLTPPSERRRPALAPRTADGRGRRPAARLPSRADRRRHRARHAARGRVGRGAARVLQLAPVFLAGQLSIGWSNDAVDAARDAAVGRADKPVARARWRRARSAAALVALVAASPLSSRLGLRAGAGPPGRGRRRLGLQPRAEGDRLVVGAVRDALRQPARRRHPGAARRTRGRAVGDARPGRCSASARTWPTCCPTSRTTAATGVRGLPHRLGPDGSTGLACVVLLLASAVVVLAPAGSPRCGRLGRAGR